jgi:hypothetical protein
LPSFTLDTNCLIAVDENRPEAGDVRTLANAHAQGRADVAVVAMSVSEKQQGNRYIQDFAEFQARLANLGLAHLKMLEPMCYFDITFHDYCLWSGDDMLTLEKQVHNILFPNVEFEWNDFCRANGLDPSQSPSGRWRNDAKCFGGIHVGREREFCRPLDRQIGRLVAL